MRVPRSIIALLLTLVTLAGCKTSPTASQDPAIGGPAANGGAVTSTCR